MKTIKLLAAHRVHIGTIGHPQAHEEHIAGHRRVEHPPFEAGAK